MAIETTYSQARDKLASLMDRVTDDLEVVIITRRGEGLEMSVEELRREVLGGEGDR